LNACTAELVTDPTVVPSSDTFTDAIVAASALNDARTSRIDWICEADRPEADTAGVVVTAGVTEVVTAGVVVAGVVTGVVVTAGVVGLLLIVVLLPPPLSVEEQSVVEGVIVTVTAVFGAYLISDCDALQISLDTPVSVLAERRSRPGAVTWNDEPD
jgi:hypothetical protein